MSEQIPNPNQFKAAGMKKLLAAQRELPTQIRADTKGNRGKYLSLPDLIHAVRPILNRHGLILIQGPRPIESAPWLATEIVDAESGMTVVESLWPMAGGDTRNMSADQALGAASTYARRYSVLSLLGITACDDPDLDAPKPQAASGAASRRTQPAHAPKAAPASGARKINSRALKPDIDRFNKLGEAAAARGQVEQVRSICKAHGLGKDVTQWPALAVSAAIQDLEALEALEDPNPNPNPQAPTS